MAPREFPSEFLLGDNFVAKPREFPSEFMLPSAPTPGPQPVDMSSDIDPTRFTDNDIPFTGGLLKIGDIARGIGQGVGAAGGFAAGGALTGGPGAAPGALLGAGAGYTGGNKFNDLMDALAAKFKGQPQPGMRENYSEQMFEGAVGQATDALAGPLFKVVGKGAGKIKEAIEPFASKIGESRFAAGLKSTTKMGKEQLSLNKIDPDAGDMEGALIKAFAPNMGEFDFTDQADIVERLYDAEKSGYFANIKSANDARKKVKEDIGYMSMVKEKAPDGRTYSREKLIPGRLQIAEENAAKAISDAQDAILNAGGLDAAGEAIGTGFDDVQEIIANKFQGFLAKKKDYYQPDEVASIYEELILPRLAQQIKLDDSGKLSFKNIHEIRKVWDDVADQTFRGQVSGGTYTTPSGLNVDPALKGNLEKEVANALRGLEESVAEKIDPVLASDFKIAKSELRSARNLSDVLTKSAVRAMKANSGIGNSVVRLQKPTMWDALSKMLSLPGTPEAQMIARAQASSKLRGNPVTANFNTSDISRRSAVDNMIAPSRLASGGFEAGAEAIEKIAGNPMTSDIASAAVAPELMAAAPQTLQGIMPGQEAPQAQATPYASLTPQRISQAMPGQQMTPAPTPRNTVSIQQNPDQFLTQLFEAASQPRLPEENALPPEVLQGRAAKMVYDVQKMLRSGNNAMIAEAMQGMSRMFPEVFEDGFSSQWDGMIADPAERGYFLKDLNIKLERKEISRSFHAKQVSEMNEYGKILDAPAPQRAPAPQPQPSPRIQTSIGAMRQPAY